MIKALEGRTYHEFNDGDRVHIIDRPFDGQLVDVKDIKDRYAYRLINLFGSTQDVAVSPDKLEKTAQPQSRNDVARISVEVGSFICPRDRNPQLPHPQKLFEWNGIDL